MFKAISYEEVVKRLQSDGYAIGAVNPKEYHKWKPLLAAELGVPVTSKSDLGDFAACPLRYKYNKDHGIKKSSDALRLGSLVDCLVLTPELFDSEYKCEAKRVALTKEGKPHAKGWQDPKQKEEWEAAEAKGITVLTPEELAHAKAIACRATEHLAERGLVLGKTFQSQVAMWVCLRSVGGVPLACPVVVTGMMDILPFEGKSIDDLKTTSLPVENEMKLMYTLEDYHYGVQAAMYTDMFNLCTGEERDEFGFFFAGTGELPVMSREVVMQTEALEFYRAMYERWIIAFAAAHALNDWGLPTLPRKFYTPTIRERKAAKGGAL